MRGDFRFWTRFLRKYVYFRVIELDLTPVPLQTRKSWGPGNEATQPVAIKYVEVYEKASPACVARMAHALHDCKFLDYSSQ